MLKLKTSKQYYDAIADMASAGFFFLDEGENIYCIKWDARVSVISHSRIPESKDQTIILHAKGVSIWNVTTSQPVLELLRKDTCITAYDDNGMPVFSIPIIDFQCMSDSLPLSRKK